MKMHDVYKSNKLGAGVSLLGLIVSLSFAACGKTEVTSGNRSKLVTPKPVATPTVNTQDQSANTEVVQKVVVAEEPDEVISAETSSGPTIVSMTVEDSGANFQVKNLNLLQSSITSCMGDGMTKVTDTMLKPTFGQTLSNPGYGLVRFLDPLVYKVGDDILVKESGNLLDPQNSNRFAAMADDITDTYLRSLEVVANVIAHNCSADNPHCSCGTKEAATEMFKRCMPSLNPESEGVKEVITDFVAICKEPDVELRSGMRVAISSMISSYGFAKSR